MTASASPSSGKTPNCVDTILQGPSLAESLWGEPTGSWHSPQKAHDPQSSLYVWHFLETRSLEHGPAATVGDGEPKARSEPDPASPLGNWCWWGFVRQMCGTEGQGGELAWGIEAGAPSLCARARSSAPIFPTVVGGSGLAAGAAT